MLNLIASFLRLSKKEAIFVPINLKLKNKEYG